MSTVDEVAVMTACICKGTTLDTCQAHKIANEHRRTGHLVIVPPPGGIPWSTGLRTAPYCLDCDWPDDI